MKFLVLLLPALLWAKTELGNFTGRVSRLNPKARLMRIRIEDENTKFLVRKNKVNFWQEETPSQKCQTLVEGRTERYILLKVPEYETCVRNVRLTVGSFLHFGSEDLKENIEKTEELVHILVKKRLANYIKYTKLQKSLEGHLAKVEAVNDRYFVLKEKLEREWEQKLSALEEDKLQIVSEAEKTKRLLNDIDKKMEFYRVQDKDQRLDRWALDAKLYERKQ